MDDFNQLKSFTLVDKEKKKLLLDSERSIAESTMLRSMGEPSLNYECSDVSLDVDEIKKKASYDRNYDERIVQVSSSMRASEPSVFKVCPKCHRRFPKSENFCPDCLVRLKHADGKVDVRNITTNPVFVFKASQESDNIITDDNFKLLNDFDFTMEDFENITHSIKAQAFENLDNIIRDNSIDLDDSSIVDKVLLFAKSFVSVEYKSYGRDLGYFEFNRIYVDDRQSDTLQITTMIHELTHFLFKEIMLHTLCKILDVSKNDHTEAVITYILSNSILNRLIDEYAAHSVEGRFTMFGYQDYSSFIAIQDEMDGEHVEVAKTIGNTFSIHIKDMLEGFLDWDARREIKDQFLRDTIERPDYAQLDFESCLKLSDEGFLKAIWLILTEGFKSIDGEVLDSYIRQLKSEK